MSIREIAKEMVKRDGLINLSRAALAEAAGIPDGSFPHVAGCSFNDLVKELMTDIELEDYSRSVSKSRVHPALRREHILAVAINLARKEGYGNITRAGIAESAGISEALVSHYFGPMDSMREQIMTEAVRQGIVEIVAIGLGTGDPIARGATPEVKQAAVELMMTGA